MTARLSACLTAISLSLSAVVHAVTVDDWGTVITPIENEASFAFAQYDIDANFTHDYLFSLEGEAGATYEVTFAFDTCQKGCGNPELSYGIYDATGGLYAAASGTIVLSAGDYAFQVSGTGMGTGNSVDYWGSLTFSATLVTSDAMVAPVPEPTTLLLTAVGSSVIGFAAYRRRRVPTIATLPGVS